MKPAKRKRRGGIQVDPAVRAFQEQGATNHAALTKAQRQERQRVRLNLDVPVAVKAALKKIADLEHEDTSMAQVASVLLAWGLQAYLAQEPAVQALFDARTPARTPRFAWNIEVAEKSLEALAVFSSNGEV